jgi:hypothetical protein
MRTCKSAEEWVAMPSKQEELGFKKLDGKLKLNQHIAFSSVRCAWCLFNDHPNGATMTCIKQFVSKEQADQYVIQNGDNNDFHKKL